MMAIGLLSEIVAQGGKVSAAHYGDDPDFPNLLQHGFLIDARVVASVLCNDCEEVHTAPVVFVSGCYGYYCPDLGFVPVDRKAIQGVLPDLPRLVGALADLFDCKKRKNAPLHGQTWRIGVYSGVSDDVMLYFHPRLQTEDDTRELETALSREVRTNWRLIVTALGTLPLGLTQSIQLVDLIELERKAGTLSILAQPDDLVGMSRKKTGGRPSIHRAALARIIEDRIQSGAVRDGLNEESRAVLAVFEAGSTGNSIPSIETVRRHVKKARGES